MARKDEPRGFEIPRLDAFPSWVAARDNLARIRAETEALAAEREKVLDTRSAASAQVIEDAKRILAGKPLESRADEPARRDPLFIERDLLAHQKALPEAEKVFEQETIKASRAIHPLVAPENRRRARVIAEAAVVLARANAEHAALRDGLIDQGVRGDLQPASFSVTGSLRDINAPICLHLRELAGAGHLDGSEEFLRGPDTKDIAALIASDVRRQRAAS